MIPLLGLCTAAFLNVVACLSVLLPGDRQPGSGWFPRWRRPRGARGALDPGAREGAAGLPRLSVPRLLAAAAAVGLLSALEALALGRGAEGLAALVFLDVVLLAPLAGALLLLLHRREHRATTAARVLSLGALVLAPVGLYARLIEPYDLRLEQQHFSLPAHVAGSRPLRVGVLSDIEAQRLGSYEWGAADRLMEARPDLVLVAGDVLQRGAASRLARDLEFVAGVRELFLRLDPPAGTWVVPGDNDEAELLASVLEGTGARLLLDETVELDVGDRHVLLLGLADADDPDVALAGLAARPRAGELRIALVHMPRAVLHLGAPAGDGTPGTVDLLVAGHTHGGQVRLPGFGPLLLPSPLPSEVAAGGLHVFDGQALFVSRGVGVERDGVPPVRFNCPPEVTLLLLE